MAPIDSWLEALVQFPHLVDWPKARAYELAPTSDGLAIQASGPLEMADPYELSAAAARFASWGTPAVPATEQGLLRLVNSLGLTGPWEEAPDGVKWRRFRGVKWEEAQGPRMRPPLSQLVEDFRKDVETVKRAVLGYEIAYAEVRRGERDPADPKGDTAFANFGEVVVGEGQKLYGEVVYLSPTRTVTSVPPARMWTGQLWGLKRPPSLYELAVSEIIAMFQDQLVVRRCENPDCGRPFTSQSPRGGRGNKAWTRPGAMYCSHECGKHASYLRRKEK